MIDTVTIVEIAEGKSALCRQILESLPDWFGIPESIEMYARDVAELPMLAAEASGSVIGFLALKQQTPVATEAYVLGVRPEWHRRGVGRELFRHAEAMLKPRGVRFMTVKTVHRADDDPIYGATCRFYEAIGFLPLEVFPTLWHERNPCLLMVKPL